MQHIDGTIVAAVDSACAAGAAVRLALVEAVLRRRPLDLLAVYGPEPDDVRRAAGCVPRNVAERRLAQTAAALRASHPEVPVRTELTGAELGSALITRSHGAAMVVLGTDGPTGPTERIAAHADAPVVVAPVVRPPGGPVVLGVDGSYLAPEAAAFAFEEAALRGVPLVAMYAWPGVADVALSGVDPFGYDVSVARGDAYRVLAEALAGWAAKYPDVPVEHRAVLAAHTGEQLTHEAAGASMLVLGARSHTGAARPALGSVVRYALHLSPCPVAVLTPHRLGG
ncbi:universal stress protein [Dactylosporangium vinaceum]|uniref:Universal stress protein n=1 Tax=Dactylosporangium vinaceum TaxID=53362 RepID=A0ABV5MCN6_9ACTN|nr:universal stress protein [Dactylosporangium vinaceum]UAC00697.1 universal stress protein [Dactylosporangium vinaceum]